MLLKRVLDIRYRGVRYKVKSYCRGENQKNLLLGYSRHIAVILGYSRHILLGYSRHILISLC